MIWECESLFWNDSRILNCLEGPEVSYKLNYLNVLPSQFVDVEMEVIFIDVLGKESRCIYNLFLHRDFITCWVTSLVLKTTNEMNFKTSSVVLEYLKFYEEIEQSYGISPIHWELKIHMFWNHTRWFQIKG